MQTILLFCVFLILCGAEELRLNQVQMLGTHNSYRTCPVIIPIIYPKFAYSHPSLETQLDLGIRQLEFDIVKFIGDEDFEVAHFYFGDYGGWCHSYKQCLTQVYEWSKSTNFTHSPLWIYLDIKKRLIQPGTVEKIVARLENITSAIYGERFLTAAELRRNHSSLREALLTDGNASTSNWPLLLANRGKMLLFATGLGLEVDSVRSETDLVLSQSNRKMMVMVYAKGPFSNESYVVILDGTDYLRVRNFDTFNNFARRGYMIRVRSDENLKEVFAQNMSLANDCLQSGAHIISSDVAYAPSRGSKRFSVRFSDTPFGIRCNKETVSNVSSTECQEGEIESISLRPPFPAEAKMFWCCGNGYFFAVILILALVLFCLSLLFGIFLLCQKEQHTPRRREEAGSELLLIAENNTQPEEEENNARERASQEEEQAPQEREEEEPVPVPSFSESLVLALFLSSLFSAVSYFLFPSAARSLFPHYLFTGEDFPFSFYLLLERLSISRYFWKLSDLHHLKQYVVVSISTAVASIPLSYFGYWEVGKMSISSGYVYLLLLDTISAVVAIVMQFRKREQMSEQSSTVSVITVLSMGPLQLLLLTLLSTVSPLNGLPPFYSEIFQEHRVLLWYLFLRSVEICVWLGVLHRKLMISRR